jgi:hypothetical protein
MQRSADTQVSYRRVEMRRIQSQGVALLSNHGGTRFAMCVGH